MPHSSAMFGLTLSPKEWSRHWDLWNLDGSSKDDPIKLILSSPALHWMRSTLNLILRMSQKKKNHTKLLISPGKMKQKMTLGSQKIEPCLTTVMLRQKEDMVETTLVQPISIKTTYNPFFSSVASKSSWFQDLKGLLCFRRGQLWLVNMFSRRKIPVYSWSLRRVFATASLEAFLNSARRCLLSRKFQVLL